VLDVIEITVCRLVTAEPTRAERLIRRMAAGPSREWHLTRTVELDAVLDHANVEDFAVTNDDWTPREIATRAGWLPTTPTARPTSTS
jgi:hypothetical protein